MSQPVASQRALLSREAADFLLALGGTLHRWTMYPDGHPARISAVDDLHERVTLLLLEQPAITLGVTPTQLLVDGQPTDVGNSFLRDFAARLHRREIAGLRLDRGITPEELNTVLTRLSEGERAEGEWAHAAIHGIHYEHLRLMDDADTGGALPGWDAQVWQGLARAATGDVPGREAPPEPEELARAFNDGDADPDRDRALMSSVEAAIDTCTRTGDSETLALQRRVSRMILALAPETLDRLLSMDKPDGSRHRRILLKASQVMALESVVDLAQAAARARGRSMSPALLQLLHKMAVHGDSGSGECHAIARSALRDQLRELLDEWDAGDGSALPELYQETLGKIETGDDREPDSAYACEPLRILRLSLAMDCVEPATVRAIAGTIRQGQAGDLLDLLDASPEIGEASLEIERQVMSMETLGILLRHDPPDWETITRLVPRIGARAIEPLLDGLAVASERADRRRLLDLLAGFGDEVGPFIAPRFAGAEWYVQRNLLTLLNMLPDIPETVRLRIQLPEVHPRVRQEAFKLLLRNPGHRDRAIAGAIVSDDVQTCHLGLLAAAEGCSPAVLHLILGRLRSGAFDPDLRVVAIRAVSARPEPAVCDCLLDLATSRTRILRRLRLRSRTPECVAALSALAEHWYWHPAASPALALAGKTRDPSVRQAIERPSIETQLGINPADRVLLPGMEGP